MDPNEVDAIHAGLDRLMRDETLAGELAQRGLARADAFTWEKAAERTWNVYQSVLA